MPSVTASHPSTPTPSSVTTPSVTKSPNDGTSLASTSTSPTCRYGWACLQPFCFLSHGPGRAFDGHLAAIHPLHLRKRLWTLFELQEIWDDFESCIMQLGSVIPTWPNAIRCAALDVGHTIGYVCKNRVDPEVTMLSTRIRNLCDVIAKVMFFLLLVN